MALAAVNTYTSNRLTPAYPTPLPARQDVRLLPSTVFTRGTVLGEILSAGAVATTINQATITAGAAAQSVVVVASTNMLPGKVVTVGTGATQETVVVLAVADGTHFTAVFNLNHVTGEAVTAGAPTASTGMFRAYLTGASDGSQVAKCILEYDCATDANGNITYGGQTGGGPFGEVWPVAPAYFSGAFKTTELTGLDAGAITSLGGHLISGILADGVYAF